MQSTSWLFGNGSPELRRASARLSSSISLLLRFCWDEETEMVSHVGGLEQIRIEKRQEETEEAGASEVYTSR